MPMNHDKSDHSSLIEACFEAGEVAVDAALSNDLLADIPIVGLAVKFAKARDSIRDRAFASKLASFASPLESKTSEQKEQFKKRLEEDPDQVRRAGETLFLVLDRLTDLDKPEILGCVYLAYLGEVISSDELRRLAQAIDLAFTDDLIQLLQTKRFPQKSQEAWVKNLAYSGLAEPLNGETIEDVGIIYYKVSPLGKKLHNAYLHGKRNDG